MMYLMALEIEKLQLTVPDEDLIRRVGHYRC